MPNSGDRERGPFCPRCDLRVRACERGSDNSLGFTGNVNDAGNNFGRKWFKMGFRVEVNARVGEYNRDRGTRTCLWSLRLRLTQRHSSYPWRWRAARRRWSRVCHFTAVADRIILSIMSLSVSRCLCGTSRRARRRISSQIRNANTGGEGIWVAQRSGF